MITPSDRASLKTRRLLLRPFRQADVDEVLAYAADSEWSRYLDEVVPAPYELADAEEFVAHCLVHDWESSGPIFRD